MIARLGVLLSLIVLSGCKGPQSTLAPAGQGAQVIADLFLWMSLGGLIIWLLVVGLGVYALFFKPEAHNPRMTTLCIFGGGIIIPIVVLTILIGYSLPLLPDLFRDDEVWAMVAFLKKLPELNKDEFLNLVYEQKDTSKTPEILRNCINCHGLNGNGKRNGAFPKLAGQSYEYLKESLHALAQGKRHSGTMKLVMEGLSDEEIDWLARYFSNLKRSQPESSYDFESLKRGEILARFGYKSKKVATCSKCHGPNMEVENPSYPNLVNQHAEYLELQLNLFKEGKRGGTKYVTIMHEIIKTLTPQQIMDISNYYESISSNNQ